MALKDKIDRFKRTWVESVAATEAERKSRAKSDRSLKGCAAGGGNEEREARNAWMS